MDSRGQVCTTSNVTIAAVRKLCVGKPSCTISEAVIKSFGDPCGGVNKRFAVAAPDNIGTLT